MSKSLRDVVDSMPAAGRRGTYRLSAEEEAVLDQFTDWLEVVDGKTRGTAQSYRSMCAKCAALEISHEDMNSDQRSATAKLKEFFEQLEDSGEVETFEDVEALDEVPELDELG